MKPILSNMLWVPRDTLQDEATLKKDLIVHPRKGLEDVQPIKSYKETDSYLGIPRNYPFQIEAEDRRVKGEPQNFQFKGELRRFQAELIDRWKQSFNEGHSDWIISADTGSGKSVIALKIAAELGVPFLVIVPLERLIGQWVEHINKFLGIPNGRIGRVQGDTCDYNNPACVGMIHSICKDKYPEAFKNRFGLIIYDECHKVSADTFSEVAGMFPSYYRLGLSATLERNDGRENLFFYHIGKNILKAEGEEQPKPKVCIYKYNKSSGSIPTWPNQKQMQRRPKILNNIAANQERNELIAYFADQLMQKGLRVLVVSERIQQLKELDKLLKVWYGYSEVGIYVSSTREETKTELLNNARCILATNQIINIGVDVPSLRGLIFATPIADCRQVVGRIRRKCSSVPDPVVVDIQDTKYNEAIGWGRKRMKFYQSKGFPIYEINK